MPASEIAEALQRAQEVLQRRPSAGLHPDVPASVRWAGGLQIVATHPSGAQVRTDMPVELGGGGEHPSPGWLVRAGNSACTATTIAMVAAERGMTLASIDVETSSISDTRGLLGMCDTEGARVSPGPSDVRVSVRVVARGVPADEVRAIVDEAARRAPMSCALRQPLPLALQIDIVAEDA